MVQVMTSIESTSCQENKSVHGEMLQCHDGIPTQKMLAVLEKQKVITVHVYKNKSEIFLLSVQ